MLRFITTPESCHEDWVELTGHEVHHMRNVLRVRRGDQVEVLDGQGRCFRVEITELGSNQARGTILSMKHQDTPQVNFSMGLGILKHKAMETAIRKSVELGVHEIHPLECRHAVPRINKLEQGDRLEKWNRIAMEAVKQCGRFTVPRITPIQTLESFCQKQDDNTLKIFFWENERSNRLNDIKVKEEVKSIAFLVGPEGGFSEEEIHQSAEQGFVSVSLGPRTLRAETVPLVALTLLQYRWGDLASADLT